MAHTGGVLHGHVLVVAFGGWTDGGEAATAAARYLLESGTPNRVVNLDAEQFLDYQVARPTVERDIDGIRRVKFPTLDIIELEEPLGSTTVDKLSVLTGLEPSRNWIAFIGDVIEAAEALSVDSIVFLGAMLADIPHTRPVNTVVTSEDSELQHSLGVTGSDYEGPIGVFTAIGEAARELGIPSLSIWGSVPHYAHNAPSPKVTAALLAKLAEYTQISIHFAELESAAKAWEQTVDAMVNDDDDMNEYVSQLESARDTVESPEATGDAIAKEFEDYLRGADEPEDAGEGDQQESGTSNADDADTAEPPERPAGNNDSDSDGTGTDHPDQDTPPHV